jgi:hypothetical protein
LLKLDAVFSREPVIQQLGRGLRYNAALPESQNLLNVFIGRDPRLSSIIEHLEREAPPPPLAMPSVIGDEPPEIPEEDVPGQEVEETLERPEILDVVEAGDAYLDHTGRFVDGQQLTMFGVAAPPRKTAPSSTPVVDVVDLAAEIQDAIDYCKTWTNRAARERALRFGPGDNHHAALNLAYGRDTGRKGTLSTPEAYRHKGDWMKRRYLELLN